jgi:hypothetical protein
MSVQLSRPLETFDSLQTSNMTTLLLGWAPSYCQHGHAFFTKFVRMFLIRGCETILLDSTIAAQILVPQLSQTYNTFLSSTLLVKCLQSRFSVWSSFLSFSLHVVLPLLPTYRSTTPPLLIFLESRLSLIRFQASNLPNPLPFHVSVLSYLSFFPHQICGGWPL